MRFVFLLLLIGAYLIFNYITTPTLKSLKKSVFFDNQGIKRLPTDLSSESKFLNAILRKPDALPLSGVNILDPIVAKSLNDANSRRYIKLSNLTFCDILNNAVIDSLAPIRSISGSIGTTNLRKGDFSALIDSTAILAYNSIFNYYADVNEEVPSL